MRFLYLFHNRDIMTDIEFKCLERYMNRNMLRWSPARIIATAFSIVSFTGSILLYLPISHMPGVQITYLDALYTAVSAMCVTGLSIVDTAEAFNSFGQIILAVLIQIGGLGVSTIGAGVLLVLGKKVGMKERSLIHDTMNLDSYAGVVRFLKTLFATTVIIELIGAALSYSVFRRDYEPLEAFGLSLFHAISSFNNAGLTILSADRSMATYADDPFMLLVTLALIFIGGLGFIVIRECWIKKFKWNKLTMHSRVSLFMSALLLVGGAVLLKMTNDVSWVVAFFSSQSARSAGFEVFPFESWSPAGLLIMLVLMFIGTSTGSTGGGVRTSTIFALALGIRRVSMNKRAEAFNYSLPPYIFRKASVVVFFAITDIIVSTFILLLISPGLTLAEAFTEMFSAFTTVGLSLGTTSSLNEWGKLLSILVMLTGRIGPITVATAWHYHEETRARYPNGNITVG